MTYEKYHMRSLLILLILSFIQVSYSKIFKQPIDLHIRFDPKFDIHFGDPNAPIIVTEYISYDCYFCGQFILDIFPKINQLIQKGKIFYIVKPEIKSTTVLHWIKAGYYLFLNHPTHDAKAINQRDHLFHQFRHQIMTKKLPIGEMQKIPLLNEMNILQEKFDEFSNQYEKRIMKEYLLIEKKVKFSPAIVITHQGKSYITTGKDSLELILNTIKK